MKRTLSSILTLTITSLGFAIDYPDVVMFEKSPLPDGLNLYDQSDIKTQGASTCVYEEFWGGKKVPVSTTYKNGGTDDNSLKISWNSKSGGDWIAGVAKSDWSTHNMDKYTSVEFYIYSETAISYNDLPNVMLTEDGFRSFSSKVSLANYIGGSQLNAGQWKKISIPVSMFGTYTAWGKTQRIAFCQRNADAVEHTIYVDDLTLIGVKGYVPPVVDQVSLFSDSPLNDRYDLSFGGQWGDGSSFFSVDTKVKVTTQTAHAGTNALHMHWKTAAGGGCFAKIETQKSEDFSYNQLVKLSMYVYAPAGLTKAQLPKIKFESSTNGTTSELPLGDFIVGSYANNQWMLVEVPLSSLKELTWAGYSEISGLTFVMVEPDAVEHQLFVDDIKVVKEAATAVDVASKSVQSVFYRNGEFVFSDYQGAVVVANLNGTILSEGIVVDSRYQQRCSSGVYFVKTASEVFKVIVR